MSGIARISVAIGFALTVTVLGCSTNQPKIRASINQSASLTGNLPANPLAWQVVTSTVDQSKSEMSTLYGNELAVAYARSHLQHDYPAGAVLSLVTWSETDDPHYFGARIPGNVKSVEFVNITNTPDGRPSFSYQLYQGAPLHQFSEPHSSLPAERAGYILSLRSAVFP